MIEFLSQHNLLGLAIGLCTFLVIGIFHPFVIKGEYYFGVKIWWGVFGSRHSVLRSSRIGEQHLLVDNPWRGRLLIVLGNR